MAGSDGPPIRPVGESKFIKLLVYALPGRGKTRFVGTSPGKVLILRPPTDHTDSILGSGAKEWVIHDWDEMHDAGEYLRHSGHKWDWVWLDSISLWQEIGIDHIWQGVINRKPARKEFGVDRGEYGINMDRLGRWVRHCVGADEFNFGVTAYPFEKETQEGDIIMMPYVQGKEMSEKICGYMNMVAYMKTSGSGKTRKRILYTDESEDFYAKDQFYCLPNGRLTNPTMPELLKYINAARAKNKPAGTSRRRPAARTRTRTARS